MVASAVDGIDLFKIAGRSISGCVCMRTLKPQRGVLQLKSHDKRKTRTPNTDQRWARRETIWEAVGGENT